MSRKLALFYGFNFKGDVSKSRIDVESKTKFALLEARLDVLLVRAQFCQTLASAKQLVRHGKVCVDGQKITISSYLVSPGQYVSLQPKLIRTSQKPPSHLEINLKTCSFVVLYEPKRIIFA